MAIFTASGALLSLGVVGLALAINAWRPSIRSEAVIGGIHCFLEKIAAGKLERADG